MTGITLSREPEEKFRGIDELTDDKSDIIDEQNGFTESSINIKA